MRRESLSRPAGAVVARSAARPLAQLARATTLFSAYALGYPLFAVWFYNRFGSGWRMQLIVDVCSLGLALFLAIAMKGLKARAPLPRATRLPIALQSLALLGGVALALRVLDPGFDEQELGLRSLGNLSAVFVFLATLPFAVAAEEILFRSCQGLLRGALGPAPSVVAVALAFAAYHWAPGLSFDRHVAETLLFTLAGGLVLGAAYERTGSIALLVGVHLAYDVLAVLQSWLNLRDARTTEAGLFFIWIVAAGALAWRLSRRSAASPEPPAGDGVAPSPAGSPPPVTAWFVAAVFGGVLPVLMAWIRYRCGS